jgi:hypothetical protein
MSLILEKPNSYQVLRTLRAGESEGLDKDQLVKLCYIYFLLIIYIFNINLYLYNNIKLYSLFWYFILIFLFLQIF